MSYIADDDDFDYNMLGILDTFGNIQPLLTMDDIATNMIDCDTAYWFNKEWCSYHVYMTGMFIQYKLIQSITSMREDIQKEVDNQILQSMKKMSEIEKPKSFIDKIKAFWHKCPKFI